MWFCDQCHSQVNYQWKIGLTDLEEKLTSSATRQYDVLLDVRMNLTDLLTADKNLEP